MAALLLLLIMTSSNTSSLHGASVHVMAQIPSDENPFAPGIIGLPPFDPDIDNTDARRGVIASAIFSYLLRFSPTQTFGDASLLIWTRAVRLIAQFGADRQACETLRSCRSR